MFGACSGSCPFVRAGLSVRLGVHAIDGEGADVSVILSEVVSVAMSEVVSVFIFQSVMVYAPVHTAVVIIANVSKQWGSIISNDL